MMKTLLAPPSLARLANQFVPVTCLKQQARKMGCQCVYGVYE